MVRWFTLVYLVDGVKKTVFVIVTIRNPVQHI